MSLSRKKRFAAAAAIAAAAALLAWAVPLILPYSAQAQLDGIRFSRVFLAKNGEELQILPLEQGLRRVFVPLEKLPKELIDIVIAAEDRRFYFHPGFDPLSIIRAAFQNISSGRIVSGASTISMQLARILRKTGEKATVGKLMEAWEAAQLERRLGKKGALELYLNLVPFGRNIEGFPAAARVFYGKNIHELSRAELSILAVVPRSPSAYDPFAEQENNRAAVLRLADRTLELALLEKSYDQLRDPNRAGLWPFHAPHFIRWLSMRGDIAAADGKTVFWTGIELELQSYIEALLKQTVEEARAKRVSNAAALFIRPDDMTVAAWVGSADFFNETDQGQVDGVTMRRQPGSTLKPFLYALALEEGFTPASILPDIPTDFGGTEVYTPANFNDQFNGPVRLRQALASSLNVPAVYMLGRLGVIPFTERLIRSGFQSLESQKGSLGLGLALGNAEISLFELTQAYGIFLHQGEFIPIRTLLEQNAATQLDEERDKPKLVYEPTTALLVRDMLTRHPDRVLSFGRDGTNRLTFEGAMKTGTSNQFNNIWAVGFTADLLGGVWLGNFGGQTVVGTADSGYPASVMRNVLEAFSSHEAFPPLEGFSRVSICGLSGMAATSACPHTITEWFKPGTEPAPCDWHIKGPRGVELRYPQEYQTWLSRYRYRSSDAYKDAELAILRPLDGSLFYLDPSLPLDKQQLTIEATGTGTAVLYVDTNKIHEGSFPLRLWHQLDKGAHRLELSNGEESTSIYYEVR